MSMEQIAEQILAHAWKHWDEGGWDFIAECWTAREVVLELERKGITEWEAALNHFEWIAGVKNEVRGEQMSMREW